MKKFVQVDVPRFKAYCTAFGGQRRMSAATGVSQEYIETRLNRCGGSIRADVFRKACELHSFSPKLLTGHGTDEEFRKALATKVALERLGKRKEKHQVCDSYCHGCIYECTAAATPPIAARTLLRILLQNQATAWLSGRAGMHQKTSKERSGEPCQS